jgi:hypothetical protein
LRVGIEILKRGVYEPFFVCFKGGVHMGLLIVKRCAIINNMSLEKSPESPLWSTEAQEYLVV